MIRERGVTLRALYHCATLAAKNVGSRATPVEKEDSLLTFLEHIFQPIHQSLTEDAAPARFEFLTHINDRDRRKTGITGRVGGDLNTLR